MQNRGSIRKLKKENTWQISFELPKDELTGKRRRKYYTFHGSKKEAEKFKTQKLSELDNGILKTTEKIKFVDYLNYWIETMENMVKKTTIEGYKHYIDKHIKPAFNNVYLQDLKKEHLQCFFNNKLKNGRLDGKGGLSSKTIKNIYVIVHQVLEMAYNSDLINKNVSNGLKLPKVKKYEANFLSKKPLMEILEKSKGTEIYIPIALAIFTGMRRGEVLGLSWNNVDFENKIVKVEQQLQEINGKLEITTPKTESSIREVYIPNIFVEILKRYKVEQDKRKLKLGKSYKNDINAVCTYETGELFNPKTFSRKFNRFLKKNNLPEIRYHDIRHSHASLLFSQNIQDKFISQRLGHSSTTTTKEIYTHLYEKDKKEVGKIIEKIFYNEERKAG